MKRLPPIKRQTFPSERQQMQAHLDRVNAMEQKRSGKNEINVNPQLPSALTLVKNFGKAVVGHIADGLKRVTLKQYKERLDVCNANECGYRLKNRCTHVECGCFLDKKAWWHSEDCPVGAWPKLDDEENGV